jgi:hypothetical protein
MAMTKKTILSVETGQAVKNVGDLRNNIKQYKKELEGLNIGSDEYRRTLTKLEENQAALRNAMHATAAGFTEVVNAATAANVKFDENNKLVREDTLSYNELVRGLAVLKEQWRATTNAAERQRVGEQIDQINNKLKTLDASVGVFGRNVGNYIGAVDHLTDGLSKMGSGAAGIVQPIKSANSALKLLSTNPVVAILGILASVLSKVVDAMKKNEEGANGLREAMAPLAAIGDALTKIFQGLGNVIVSIVGGFAKLTSAILGNNAATEKRITLAREEAALAAQQRDTLVQNAKDEREIARLRAEASDKINHNAAERIALLEEAGKKEKEIAERSMEDARKQYAIIKARNSLSKSSKEELDEEARALVAKINAETAYFKKVREINAGLTEARRQEAKDARDAAKAVKDAATAKINAEKEYLTQLLSIVKNGSESEWKIQNTIAKKEYEADVAAAKQKITNRTELNRTLEMLEKALQLKLQKNREEYAEKQRAQMLLELANYRDGFDKNTEAYLQAQIAYTEEAAATLKQKVGESDQEFLARRIAANEALKKARLDLTTWEREQEDLKKENDLTVTSENQMLEMENTVALAEWRLAKVHEYGQLENETAEEYRQRDLAAQRAYNDATQQLSQARVKMMQTWAGNISGLLGGIADAWEAMSDDEEKAAEQTKAIRIVTSIIDTISGAIGAYMSAVSPTSGIPAPYNMILGAIQAATVTATGMANIAKLRSTNVKGGGSGNASVSMPAAVAAPSVQPEVTTTRAITTNSEEERLNQMASPQRVYILDSDLQANEQARRVQVAETTF